jgi:hypothetical protein
MLLFMIVSLDSAIRKHCRQSYSFGLCETASSLVQIEV